MGSLFSRHPWWCTLTEFDIYHYFGPASEAIVETANMPAGTYQYFCDLHSDGTDGMVGVLVVEES